MTFKIVLDSVFALYAVSLYMFGHISINPLFPILLVKCKEKRGLLHSTVYTTVQINNTYSTLQTCTLMLKQNLVLAAVQEINGCEDASIISIV